MSNHTDHKRDRPLAIINGLILDATKPGDPAVGGVLIGTDGRITEVGPMVSAPADAEVIDAQGGIIMPGIVDAHRHAWMPAMRTVNGDMTLYGYVRTTRNLIMPHYTPEDVHVGNVVGYWDALDAGVTSMVDFSHCLNSPDHARAAVAALREVPIRAAFAAGLNDVARKVGGYGSLHERLEDIRELMTDGLPDRAEFWISTSDVTQTGTGQLVDEVRAIREVGVPITLHGRSKMLTEPVSEILALHEADLLSDDILWAHIPQADAHELKLVSDSGGRVVVAPEDELQMGMGFPIIRQWEALGGRPALGVSVVTAASGDQFGTMRLGLQSMRALDHEEEMARTHSWPTEVRLQARDAVRWATANGAHALGLEDQIGSLDVGKRGDVIVIKPGVFSLPMINPWSTVVVQTSRHDVSDVVVNGHVVKRDGVLGADVSKLKEQLMESHRRIFEKVDAAGGLDLEVELPR